MLRIHDVGDHLVPVSMVQAYDALVRKNGKEALYRTAFTKAPTHCGFTLAESAAAIETMTRRLDTGRWGSTEPEQLNELARSLDPSSTSRFIAVDGHEVVEYNRTWIPN